LSLWSVLWMVMVMGVVLFFSFTRIWTLADRMKVEYANQWPIAHPNNFSCITEQLLQNKNRISIDTLDLFFAKKNPFLFLLSKQKEFSKVYRGKVKATTQTILTLLFRKHPMGVVINSFRAVQETKRKQKGNFGQNWSKIK